MRSSRGLITAGAIAGVAMIAGGCGEETVDSGQLEDGIKKQIGIVVSCPDDVTFEEGKKFNCEGAEVNVAPPAPGAPATGAPKVNTQPAIVEVTLTGEDSASFIRTK